MSQEVNVGGCVDLWRHFPPYQQVEMLEPVKYF